MDLFTKAQSDELAKNGFRLMSGDFDHFPVVKLFTPTGNATWLLSATHWEDHDSAFGLCDNAGSPMLGWVSLVELQDLPVERDTEFTADKPLSAYAAEASAAGRINA
jgi:hypothetical protein